jgi:hypothetical protein
MPQTVQTESVVFDLSLSGEINFACDQPQSGYRAQLDLDQKTDDENKSITVMIVEDHFVVRAG